MDEPQCVIFMLAVVYFFPFSSVFVVFRFPFHKKGMKHILQQQKTGNEVKED